MANQVTPINFFGAANPDLYQQQLSLQQRQALAQRLMEQGSEPLVSNQPTNPGGFVPRISPLTGATQAGKMLAGALMQRNINEQQADLAGKQMQAMMQMLRPGGAGAAGNAPTPTQAPAQPTGVSDASSASVGAPWAAASQVEQPAPQAQPAPAPQNDQIADYMRLAVTGQLFGPEAAKVAAAGLTPTDLQKNIQGAGFAPGSPQAAAAYGHALNPPISTRYGIFSNDPNARFYPAGGALPPGALPYQFGPGGQVDVRPYPGQIAGTAAIAGAQAGGKFPYEEVETASGRKVPAFTIPGLVPQTPGVGVPPAPAAQPSAPPLPVTTQGDPWKTMPKLEQPEGVGQTTYQRGRQQGAAAYATQMAEKFGPIAESANQRKAFNDQSLALVDRATTGPGGGSITAAQNWLTSRLGIPESQLAKASAGDPTATLELNKNLINAATQTAKANYGSRMTQSEVMMQIKQASPNVDMTKAAIRYLLLTDNARAEYQMKQAQDLGRYVQQGGDPYQFEGWYARTFPVSVVTMAVGRPAERQNLVKDVTQSGAQAASNLGGWSIRPAP